jgi:uncharacterized protein (TIGR03067 family)
MKTKWVWVLAAGLAIAAAPATDDAKKDADAILGTWKVESVEQEGQKNEGGGAMALTFKKDTYTVSVEGNEIEEGGYKLDPEKKPKTIDFTITKGNDKGKKQQGIYSLDGDTMKICVTMPEKDDRPKEMSTKAGTMHILFVLKRDKK